MKEEIVKRVMQIMDWSRSKAEWWFYTENPNFGGASPDTLVNRERGHKILSFLDHAEDRKRAREKSQVIA